MCFVQTETSSMLGMELAKSDKAYAMKKRLQLALDIPTEENSLTHWDLHLFWLLNLVISFMVIL